MKDKEYDAIVEKIIKTKSFGRSNTYANLLRYLVASSIKNDVPKETTIAADIFGKTTFDPSQSTLIRVYVYNLRKKLKAYYQNEGRTDAYILRIPKGSYRIEISKKHNNKTSPFTKLYSKPWLATMLILLLASVLTNFYLTGQKKQIGLVSEQGLWKDLLHSKKTTMVVLGDLFIYTERDSTINLDRNIRDPQINSKADFEKSKSNLARPGVDINIPTYSLLIQSSSIWIKNLTEIFFSEDKDYTIRSISRFNPKELQDHDFIVVGMIKTLGIFKAYFKNSDFDFNPEEDELIYNDSTNKKKIRYKPSGNPDSYHTDYGFMAKFPGPNNNTVYLLGGIWDTGATQSLKNFTNHQLLESLTKTMKDKFGELPQYYEVLFEVNGVDRMELSSKIVHLNKIEKTRDVWEVGS
ncbi:hypothetical protein [uncultured Kriegella sp.]|uniref:hypothetical protein n=1 Tax=uncultured Kriegella sp. TaxID=1798910 RepID=UPI0030D80563|tara:strand:- start:3484 stop:4710 length:1227 start_codon:yes stop_codon:yes gene_type:complete